MVNITHKVTTLRKAVATARVQVSNPETISAIQNGTVPKGNVFEFARAAGLLAIKRTSDVIPDCHPLPVEFSAVTYTTEDSAINISVEVHTIYRTGVEVEAMHGAAIVALTLYDMLKPIDSGIEIASIKLLSKSGGKSESRGLKLDVTCAVVVCSDSVATGTNVDEAGKKIMQKLEQHGLSTGAYAVIPDDFETIQQKARILAGEKFNLVVFCGGTGLYRRDVTPEAIAPLLDREIPGIMEAARNYGQQRTPYAMLSRGVAGFINNTLVLTLPGSTRGAVETMDALFPYVTHIFRVAEGLRHTDD